MTYRYDHFSREQLRGEDSFQSGPGPGQPFPDFDLQTLDGGRLSREDILGGRPTLFTLGSFT